MYQHETQQRITVHDAARVLGISEDAVRMRVKRGKLQSDKIDGRLYVLLENEPTRDPTGADLASELLEELRSRVSYLEAIISTRDEEIRRRDVIISQLTTRIPEIEGPRAHAGATQEPESVATVPEGSEPQNGSAGAYDGAGSSQRSWWKRLLNG